MKDDIIDEDILEIFINKKKAFQMVFSMTDAKALAAGFLFTQGIIQPGPPRLKIFSALGMIRFCL